MERRVQKLRREPIPTPSMAGLSIRQESTCARFLLSDPYPCIQLGAVLLLILAFVLCPRDKGDLNKINSNFKPFQKINHF
jgi:hypothetical protein